MKIVSACVDGGGGSFDATRYDPGRAGVRRVMGVLLHLPTMNSLFSTGVSGPVPHRGGDLPDVSTEGASKTGGELFAYSSLA